MIPADEPADVSNLTPRAQQALSLAREEAHRLRDDCIGTEHVLLGLIKLGQGVGVKVLKNLGLNLENVRVEVEKLVENKAHEKAAGSPQYALQTIQAFKMAKEEARALQHAYIGTEHLLLALLRESGGAAAEIFQKFQLDAEQVHKGILKELDPNFGGGQKG